LQPVRLEMCCSQVGMSKLSSVAVSGCVCCLVARQGIKLFVLLCSVLLSHLIDQTATFCVQPYVAHCLCACVQQPTATHAGIQSRMPPLHSWPTAGLSLRSSSCPPVNKTQTGLCPVSAHQSSNDKQRGSWGAARAVLGWSTAQGSRKEAKTQVGIYSLPDLCTARSVQNKTKKVQPAC
jgi:hypothetical protein